MSPKRSSIQRDNISSLTTLDATVDILRNSLHKYRRSSDLFIPSELFYKEVLTVEDVQQMVHQLFKWLGIKHTTFVVHVSALSHTPEVTYSKHKHAYSVTLGLQALKQTSLTGALLARYITDYIIKTKHAASFKHYSLSDNLLTLATIELGLGILCINTASDDNPAIKDMDLHEYYRQFITFTREHAVVDTVWRPYVTPAAERHLNMRKLNDSKSYIPPVRKIRHANRIKIVRQIALVFIVSFFSLFSAIAILQPKVPTSELRTLQEKINLLDQQYSICTRAVKNKQTAHGTDDIFINRTIENDQSRCQSLKNQHNYYVDRYNYLQK